MAGEADEDGAQVPQDEDALKPVLVEVPEIAELEAAEAAKGIDDKPLKASDDGAQALREQLQAKDAQIAQANHRAAEADARTREAIRIAQDRDAVARNAHAQTQEAQYDTLTNGLGQAQAEEEAASRELQAAKEAQDYAAEVVAQRKMNRAQGRIQSFEGAIGQLANDRQQQQAWAEQQARQPQQQRQQQQPVQLSPEQIAAEIDADPQLIPAEKAWLKKHPEARMNKDKHDLLRAAYNITVARGFARGSDAYIRTLDEAMGYSTEKPRSRGGAVSAPASSRASSGNGTRMVPVTRAEQDLAQALGLSTQTWANSKAKLADDPDSLTN